MIEVAITVRGLLDAVAGVIAASSIAELAVDATLPRREARELVAALLESSPGAVSRASDHVATDELVALALKAAARRADGEPLAYCTGSSAFRHLVLRVDRRVLIPRPETEVVVEEALKLSMKRPGGIAVDIGTGSGAIGLSLATEGSFDRVIATDISPDAIAVARENARRILADPMRTLAPVEFRVGADFGPVAGIKARVLVSNPPYIAFEEASQLPTSVREWEPSLALFAADGGMARYDALLRDAPHHLEPGGWIVLEVDARRARLTAQLAERNAQLSSVQLVRDLAGRERVLLAQATGHAPSSSQ